LAHVKSAIDFYKITNDETSGEAKKRMGMSHLVFAQYMQISFIRAMNSLMKSI
jgi:hypothetical protein